MKNITQLTFGNYGHTLHHCQIISPDNDWVVYDTRNNDTEIATTTRIERVNVITKEIEILYETNNPNSFGPGVGAATYSPVENKVMFIHGILNANQFKPYGMSRRTAGSILIDEYNKFEFLDARNIYEPFTPGALRGGTHSHAWNHTGDLISFTYNDYILEMENLSNERVVGVMFPKAVLIPKDLENENISGKMFSVIISDIVDNARFGSDEIEKAFDECWLGDKRTIVFQGWVRDEIGALKTEIFKVDLPKDLTIAKDNLPLEGTINTRPNTPKNVFQERLTYTPNGISKFRFWLRASSDGENVFFLMEDQNSITNIFCLNISNGKIYQVTFHNSSIHSPINLSPDDSKIIYLCNNSLCLYSLNKRECKILIENDENLYGIPNFDKTGNVIFFNKYISSSESKKYLQIFKIEL